MTRKELEIMQEKRSEYLHLEMEALKYPEKYKYTSEQYSAMYDAISEMTMKLLGIERKK